MNVLGIDIGGTNFRLGIVREDLSLAKFEKIPTPSVFCSGDVLGDLAGFMKSASGGFDFDAVTIGFPATLNRERTEVVQAPNIPFMEKLPVVDALEEALAKLQKEQYPDTPIGEMFLRHGQERALADFIDGMACAAAAEINILDPDHVLLGGGVLNMKGFPRALFDEKLREHTRKPLPWQELRPVYTEDEPHKSVVGGAIYARRKLAG